MMDNLSSQTPYSHLWHKYRPVLLRLMIDAHEGPQRYAFSAHEFTRIHSKHRGGLSFILYMRRSKAINNIKTSLLAHSLVGVLQESKTAVRLTEGSTFEFKLDEHFIMHVRKSEGGDGSVGTSAAASLEIADV